MWSKDPLAASPVCVSVCLQTPLSLSLLFSGDALKHWKVKTAYLLASPLAGGLLGWVVGRAKQCLDFAATIHVIHIGITWLATGFPRTIAWWVVNAACVALTSSAGEYICININLGSIRVKGVPKAPRPSRTTQKLKARVSDAHER